MPRIVFIVIFFAGLTSARAQLSVEIAGGPNLAGTEGHEPGITYHRSLGYIAGVSVLQDAQPTTRVKLSVFYRLLHERPELDGLPDNNYNFITIPLTIGLKTNAKTYFFGDAGLYMSFLMHNSSQVVYPGENGEPQAYSDLTNMDLGATGSFGLHIHISDDWYLTPQFSGYYGLKDLVKDITIYDDLQVYSINFMMGIGYTFQSEPNEY